MGEKYTKENDPQSELQRMGLVPPNPVGIKASEGKESVENTTFIRRTP